MQEVVSRLAVLCVHYSLFLVEALLVSVAFQLSYSKTRLGSRWLAAADRLLGRLASRKGLAVVVVGASALIGRAALSPFLPSHQPLITDEFSYLLAGDTFASGRITNPPHPMRQHFEGIHVLEYPTYMSMYTPAQGLVLAAGTVLARNPWVGVYLSVGLMCAAICWMLQGWLPPRWALIGGLLAVLRLGLFGYWMNSYWGGAVAAIGGALALGALPRLMHNLRLTTTLLLGAGAAILAASRPYEGGALCVGIGVIVLAWLFGKRRPPTLAAITRFWLPITLTLAITALGMGYYFYRVTGSPFRLPEVVQRIPYAQGPIFLWDSVGPAHVYRHKALHDFYAVWEIRAVEPEISSFPGLVWNAAKKIIDVWLFFLGPALTIPLLFLPQIIRRDRRMRRLMVIGAFSIVAIALNAWFYPHYAAPIAGLLFALVAQGLRHLRVWRRRQGEGLLLAHAMPAICAAMIAVRLAAGQLGWMFPPTAPMTWYHTPDGNVARAQVLEQLSRENGGQLAIVRYGPNHDASLNEWVYNRADIDGSKVVWARDMSPAENRELLDYFHDRHAWLVEADEKPPKIYPYPR